MATHETKEQDRLDEIAHLAAQTNRGIREAMLRHQDQIAWETRHFRKRMYAMLAIVLAVALGFTAWAYYHQEARQDDLEEVAGRAAEVADRAGEDADQLKRIAAQVGSALDKVDHEAAQLHDRLGEVDDRQKKIAATLGKIDGELDDARERISEQVDAAKEEIGKKSDSGTKAVSTAAAAAVKKVEALEKSLETTMKELAEARKQLKEARDAELALRKDAEGSLQRLKSWLNENLPEDERLKSFELTLRRMIQEELKKQEQQRDE